MTALGLGKVTFRHDGEFLFLISNDAATEDKNSKSITINLDELSRDELMKCSAKFKVCVGERSYRSGAVSSSTPILAEKEFSFKAYLSPAQHKAIRAKFAPAEKSLTAGSSAASSLPAGMKQLPTIHFGTIEMPLNSVYRIHIDTSGPFNFVRDSDTKPGGTLKINLDRLSLETLRSNKVTVSCLTGLDPDCKDGEEFGDNARENWVSREIDISHRGSYLNGNSSPAVHTSCLSPVQTQAITLALRQTPVQNAKAAATPYLGPKGVADLIGSFLTPGNAE